MSGLFVGLVLQQQVSGKPAAMAVTPIMVATNAQLSIHMWHAVSTMPLHLQRRSAVVPTCVPPVAGCAAVVTMAIIGTAVAATMWFLSLEATHLVPGAEGASPIGATRIADGL